MESKEQLPAWFRKRRYLHFDRPVGVNNAEKIVCSPNNVAHHAFYPLIKYQIISTKIRRATNGSKLEYKEKIRDISYAAHLDAHIYSYYSNLLNSKYENFLANSGLTKCVLAFRSLGKSNIEFAAEAFSEISRRFECAAVALDVSGFFDNLNHQILKKQWCDLIGCSSLPDDQYNLFRSLTRFSTVERDSVYKQFGITPSNPKYGRHRICAPKEFRTKVRDEGLISTNQEQFGIPQGTPISAMLSNIYMMEFDAEMNAFAKSVDGLYLRYCDDILFVVPLSEIDNCGRIAGKSISALKLSINSTKTERRAFKREKGVLLSDKPLQYLGFTFDGQQILIRSAAFARFSNRMKRGVRLAKATSRRWNKLRKERGSNEKPLYRRKLYNNYSYLGKRNFLSYGHRAAKLMNSDSIRGQLKPLWSRLLAEIEKE